MAIAWPKHHVSSQMRAKVTSPMHALFISSKYIGVNFPFTSKIGHQAYLRKNWNINWMQYQRLFIDFSNQVLHPLCHHFSNQLLYSLCHHFSNQLLYSLCHRLCHLDLLLHWNKFCIWLWAVTNSCESSHHLCHLDLLLHWNSFASGFELSLIAARVQIYSQHQTDLIYLSHKPRGLSCKNMPRIVC